MEIDPEVFRPVLVPGGSLISRGSRASESDAYYRVLDHARRVEPGALQAAATRFLLSRRKQSVNPVVRRQPVEEFPVFVDLYNNVKNPEVYLGQPVTLRGHVRRVVEMPAGANDFGIEMLYEVWLFTADSQQHPVVVIMTSVPGELLKEVGRLKAAGRPVVVNGVSGSGYFFKMYGYPAADAYRFAPLVLGGQLNWTAPQPAGLNWSLPLVLAVGLGIFGVPIVWFVWRNRCEDRRRREQMASVTPETLDWIDGTAVRDEDGGAAGRENAGPLEET